MCANRRPRASRVLLALVCCLALLAPLGAGPATAGADPAASLAARAGAGLEQGLLGDRPGGFLDASGGKRDDRLRSGLVLVGLLVAAATAATWTVPAGRQADPRRGRAAAAGPRAPPWFQPAPI